MKKRRTAFIYAMLIALLASLVGGAGQGFASGSGSWHQASTGFASVQGTNQWSYQLWDGSSYSNLSFDSLNGVWHMPSTYVQVGPYWQHPDSNKAAVRKWTAPHAGVVHIQGSVSKLNTGGGDGVNVRVLHNATVLVDSDLAYDDAAGLPISELRKVAPGDTISFQVGMKSNPYFDATSWDPTVTYVATELYRASDGFGSVQGGGQWHYQTWNGSAYTNMTYDAPNQLWEASGSWASVGPVYMHPDAGKDAVRKWIAPADGVIRIAGPVKKWNTGGDGVRVEVLHNTDVIFQEQLENDDVIGYTVDLARTVAAGDAIYFRVNRLADTTFDGTHWDPRISFTPSSAQWEFAADTEGWNANHHTTISAGGGSLLVNVTGSDPSIVSPDDLNLSIAQSCQLVLRYKNNTANNEGKVYFTTKADPVFDEKKSKSFAVVVYDSGFTEYTVNMCEVYGWSGSLKQLRLDPSNGAVASGSYSVDYVRLQTGGTGASPFTLSEREVIYPHSIMNLKGLTGWADGVMGVLRNGRDNYDFYGSNGMAAGKLTKSTGSLQAPAATIQYAGDTIAGVPSKYPYASIGPVHRDETSGNIIAITHLEQWPTAGPSAFTGSLGLSVSKDGGDSWSFIGEIIEQNLSFDVNQTVARDSGNGSFVIVGDYFYVYSIDFAIGAPNSAGISVSRSKVSDVLTAAFATTPTVTAWEKYYAGGWGEPALGGRFQNLVGSNVYAGFNSVQYNEYLDKYVMAMTTVMHWPNNLGDISLFITDDPLDFDVTPFPIDVGTDSNQYPTLVGLGENPQTTSGRTLYVYYVQSFTPTWWDVNTTLSRKTVTFD